MSVKFFTSPTTRSVSDESQRTVDLAGFSESIHPDRHRAVILALGIERFDGLQ